MMKAAIILARGGSIGLPNKNILTFVETFNFMDNSTLFKVWN